MNDKDKQMTEAESLAIISGMINRAKNNNTFEDETCSVISR